MKRCFAWAIALFAISASVIAANQITGYVQVNPPISPQPGSFNISSGTVGQFTDTGLTTGGCVQATIGGLLTTTGVNCGSGGGGGSGSGTINSAAQYSAPYYSIVSSNVVSGLAPGTSGYFYTTAGISAAPFWSRPVSTVTVASLGALSSSTIIPSNQFSIGYYSAFLTSQTISGDTGFTTDGSGGLSAKSLFASSLLTAPNFVISGLSNVSLAVDSFGNVIAAGPTPPPDGVAFLANNQQFTGWNGFSSSTTLTGPLVSTSSANFTARTQTDSSHFDVLTASTTSMGAGSSSRAIRSNCSGSGGGGSTCIGSYNESTYNNSSGNAIGSYNAAVGIGNNSAIELFAANGTSNHAINILAGDIKQTLTNTILATDGNGIIISTTVTGGGSSSGSSVYPATATASFPFGYSASTATVGNATSTTFGNASYATINSSGSSQNLTININGQPSGGVQNKVGGVTINALGPGGPPIDMLVLYSSYTSAQGGSAMLSLWQDNPLRNDPMIWLHRVNFDSSPEMRWDGPSPNMEMVMNSGLNNAIGEGKWEPFAIANGSRHMQCGNNRANDNSTFENLCELYPLYSATEMPGVYYHAQSLANDSGILSSSDTASANFFSLNAHTVGITGPQNPSASYTFGLPDTVGAAGEFWYNSGNRGGNFNVRQLKHSGLDMVYGPTTGLTVSTITTTTELIAAPIGNGTIAGPLNLQNPNIGAGNFYVGTNYYDNGASLTSPWFFGLHYGLSPTGWLFTDNAGATMARVNNTLSSSQFVKTDTTQGLISYDLLAGSQTYSGENIFTSSAGIHSTTITSQCAQWDAAGNLNGSGSACGSGGGGGGTTTQYASQLVDCQVVRASASSLGIASSATVTNPCTISFGSQIYQFTSSSTLTLGSSTGTVRIYVSNSGDGTGAGTLQAAWSSATGLTGSGINVQTTDSVFGGGVPLGLWNATVAGTWDATGTDNRAWLNSTKPLLGGSGMTVTETATSQTVSFNGQVVVPNTSAYGLIISSSANLSNPFLAVSTNGVTTLNGATQISSGSYLIAVSSSILAGSTTGFALDTFFNLKSSGSITSTLGINASSMVITTSNLTMVVSSNGYTGSTGGSAPTFSGCGTTPTVTAGSNNMRGSVTMTSGLSSACTIIPATPVPQNYFCTISGGGAGTAVFFQQSGNLTAACDNATGLVTCGVGTFMIWNCSGTN